MFYLLINILQMQILKTKNDVKEAIQNVKNLGFVPTMGTLHKGHISLIKNSKKLTHKTLISIFINPIQFNDKKDFKKYPKNLKRDMKIIKKLKVDFLFVPNVEEIYNKNLKSSFNLHKEDKILCAFYRKGHFEGVLEVMNRLLTIVKPKKLFLGEKDFQQQFLIKKYLQKKHKFELHVCKTIRDDKLALSSRNYNLSKASLTKAKIIAKEFFKIKKKFSYVKFRKLNSINKIKEYFEKKYIIKIDYLDFRNSADLKKTDFKKNFKLFVAYYLNNVRLIDNF